jgi:hypothetical protein
VDSIVTEFFGDLILLFLRRRGQKKKKEENSLGERKKNYHDLMVSMDVGIGSQGRGILRTNGNSYKNFEP